MDRAFESPPRAPGKIPLELSWEATLAGAIALLRSAAPGR
jgi:hypothetical protein